MGVRCLCNFVHRVARPPLEVRLFNYVHELLSIFQVVLGQAGRLVSSWKIRLRAGLPGTSVAQACAGQDLCRRSEASGTSSGIPTRATSFIELRGLRLRSVCSTTFTSCSASSRSCLSRLGGSCLLGRFGCGPVFSEDRWRGTARGTSLGGQTSARRRRLSRWIGSSVKSGTI